MKPDLMAETVLDDPQDSHWTKYSLFSFVNSVSTDLHVLQVTYSTFKLQLLINNAY